MKLLPIGDRLSVGRKILSNGLKTIALSSILAVGCYKAKEADVNMAVNPLLLASVLAALKYPETKKVSTTENWNGTQISDDYSWLEKENNEVNAWVDEQNALTKKFVSTTGRESIKTEIEKLLQGGDIGNVSVVKDKQFQWRRAGSQNHSVLYVKDKKTNVETIVLNPNKLSDDGTRAVDWTQLSKDGKFLAYGVSDGGTEKSTLKIKDVDTNQDLADEIPNTRACSIAWLPDNSGFYYTKYPEIGTVPKGEENYHRKLYFHKIGSDYKTDPLIFEPKNLVDWTNVSISEDGKWITVDVNHGWTANDVYIANREDGKEKVQLKPLFVGKDNHLSAQVFDGNIYMMTDMKASKFKVMKVSLNKPDVSDISKWEEIVKEENNLLENMYIVDGKLVLAYLEKAYSRLDVVDPKSGNRQTISLPAIGTVSNVTGREDDTELFYKFESFNFPPAVYKVNVSTLEQEKIDGLKVDIDLSGIETNQVTYNSKDGTKVTMFLIHKKGLEKNSENKILLYGYGGFNVGMTPSFARSFVYWVQNGGVLAIPNLRGGNEYGEEWHRAGMLDKKQNVFDDFISAAEYLISEKYTKPEKLAIRGGSNGGLLVGAVLTQRPDLFKAVVCQVPLLDMIHYDRTQIAKLWISEYGDPANPEHFKFLYKYSPYHNVKDGAAYPATLITTADGDSRVDPMHARKMTALLQAANSSTNPILLLVEKKAGHGASRPINKVIEETADIYSFLNEVLK